jgi:hypothetical protein
MAGTVVNTIGSGNLGQAAGLAPALAGQGAPPSGGCAQAQTHRGAEPAMLTDCGRRRRVCGRGPSTALPLLALLAFGACDRTARPEEEGPPAAALARLTGMQLHEALVMFDRELVAASRARLEGTGADAFIRAETISDRLLETRFPFEWLRTGGYSVQARVRQIQSLADRIESLLSTGAPRDSALAELRRLRLDVLGLRRDLAQGGTGRPVSLDRLLAGRDTLDLFSGEGATGE